MLYPNKYEWEEQVLVNCVSNFRNLFLLVILTSANKQIHLLYTMSDFMLYRIWGCTLFTDDLIPILAGFVDVNEVISDCCK